MHVDMVKRTEIVC